MSLSSSLNAGVAGLLANSTRLATISDNIANSSTNGYRRADVEFASLVTTSSSGRFSAGGVRAAPFRDIATSGSLISTGNSTDLAVAGRGMLPVTEVEKADLPRNERPFILTPTGSFELNENGFLVTKTGLALLGFPTTSDGQLLGPVARDGASSLEPVQVSPFINAAQSTTRMSLGVNLPARGTEFDPGGPVPFESPIEYFDSIGRGNTVRAVYTPVLPAAAGDPPTNSWTLEFFDSASATPGTAIATYDLVFDDTRTGRGNLLSVTPVGASVHDPATGIATIDVVDGPIEVFIGSDLVDGGMSQLDAEFAPTNISKNGAPAGTLASLEIDDKGVLNGLYDTGQRVSLFKIPVANVPNPNGLIMLSSQAAALSPRSGNVFLHDAGTGPVGSIESFSLQQSTVDVARELTDLIQTQRAYSSNATVIQTVDEMLQETTNLKR